MAKSPKKHENCMADSKENCEMYVCKSCSYNSSVLTFFLGRNSLLPNHVTENAVWL